MDILFSLYEHARIAMYIISGISFYFCFYLLYIAGVSKELSLNYSIDYQHRFLEETGLSSNNLKHIWRKIHNFGLFGSFFIILSFNMFMFIPIIFILFSIFYISTYMAKLKALHYGQELVQKTFGKSI